MRKIELSTHKFRKILCLTIVGILSATLLSSCGLSFDGRHQNINEALKIMDYQNTGEEIIYESFDGADGVFVPFHFETIYYGSDSFDILEERLRNSDNEKIKCNELKTSKSKENIGIDKNDKFIYKTTIKRELVCYYSDAKIEVESYVDGKRTYLKFEDWSRNNQKEEK